MWQHVYRGIENFSIFNGKVSMLCSIVCMVLEL